MDTCIEIRLANIQKVVKSLIDGCFLVTPKSEKKVVVPWMMPYISHLISLRKSLFFMKKIVPHAPSLQHKFAEMKKTVESEICKSKTEFFMRISNNSRTLWNETNGTQEKKSRAEQPNSIPNEAGEVLTDSKEISRHLNHYFASVALTAEHESCPKNFSTIVFGAGPCLTEMTITEEGGVV